MTIIILSPEDEKARHRGRDYRVRRTWELMATMHDQGIVSLSLGDHDPRSFAPCLAMPKAETHHKDAAVEACIRAALATRGDPSAVVVLIEEMKWQSAAQQMTCIAAGHQGIGRNPMHLADLFHRYDFVRKAKRVLARECLADALGVEK